MAKTNNEKKLNKDRILLFIPMYNCEKQIVRVLNRLDDSVMRFISHTILVNNCSTDQTEEVARKWCEQHDRFSYVSILRNRENIGFGGNHKVGFQYAIDHDFDYVIVLHGDDQADPHDLLPILESGEYRRHSCCLGARFQKGSRLIGYSRFRTMGNRVFNQIYSMALGLRVYDCGCGLKLYDVDMIRNRYYLRFPDELWFEYALVMALKYYRQEHYWFPVTWREEDQVSNVRLVKQTITALGMLASYLRSPEKYMEAEHRGRTAEDYRPQTVYGGKNE